MTLFKHTQKREREKWEREAAVHGIKIKRDAQSVSETKVEDSFKFGSPEDYENMTQEKKEEITQKMKGKHRAWRSSVTNKLG